MIWQDLVFGVGAIVFSVALLPFLFGNEKPPISTSIPTGVTLILFAFAQASLSLWVACITSVIASIFWLTLAIQKYRMQKVK